MATKYTDTLCPQVIYVFRISDSDHEGCLKIGMSKLSGSGFDLNNLPENCEALNKIAHARISKYTSTAAVRYDLLHTECSLFWGSKGVSSFDDHQIHEILLRSGIKKKIFPYDESANEWYITDLQTVKKAIAAAKQGRKSLNAGEITTDRNPIQFRPEQSDAIRRTVQKFQVPGSRMLWNCKMRFGKTLSALQVVKEVGFTKTLIVTHRPVVDAGWYEDFDKIFYDRPDYKYGSQDRGETFESLVNQDDSFVYFASLQFLRQTADTTTKDLRDAILSHKWDLLIVDEAHEGTLTDLGQNVLKRLQKRKTCVINLSGTPFNIVSNYNPDEIVNWTYVDEQREKEKWSEEHPCDYNPYGGLPHMNMAIYDLNEVFDRYESRGGDVQFNFREFFRTWTGQPSKDGRKMPAGATIDSFVHEDDVKKFLDLLVDPSESTNYPFSTEEYRSIFRHTFWVLPGVSAAKALSELLRQHPVFQQFEIINVAGDGDDGSEHEEALEAVNAAIGNHPEETYTITLSCGRLTTGVSVKAWTAVFMLYGATKTKAQGYMQTIFRVQTPAVIGGKRKEECYVFDFAPDRIITAIDETIRANSYANNGKPGTQTSTTITDEERQGFKDFMHYCSVIAYDGSQMRPYDVTQLLEHLKRVQIDRVVRNGFEDDALYNNELLMNLDGKALTELEGIKGIIGSSPAQPKMGDFTVNKQDVDGSGAPQETTSGSGRASLTPEEKLERQERARRRKQKKDAISILRGISIRIPMLIYGADVKDEETGITLDNFTSFIDKDSWAEFMPPGISMQKFYSLRKYYDPDVFNACGKRIRAKAAAADALPPLERIHRIEDILSTFKNPDKETVITPWRVVNMHLSDTIGGYDFYDEDHQFLLDEPRYVDRGKVTYCAIEKEDPKILEINSKSGRYPLYMAYSIFREKLKQWADADLVKDIDNPTLEEQLAVWDDVVQNNIFVLCKTPMAARITKRTLVGYRNVPVLTKYVPNLLDEVEKNKEGLVKKIKQGRAFWHVTKENSMIHFDAIVSNPPYHESQATENTATNSALAGALYPGFIDLAEALADKVPPTYVSMITESRWMTKAGRGVSDDWVESQLHCNNFIQIHDFLDAEECFRGVQIKGGVSYFLYKPGHKSTCKYILHQNGKVLERTGPLDSTGAGIVIRDAMASQIIEKVSRIEGRYFENKSFMNLVGPSTWFCDCSKGILDTNWDGYVKKEDDEHNIKYYLNKSLEECGFGWIKRSDMPKGFETIPLHKVYIPKAGGSGIDKTVLGTPFYGEPNSVCSRTYICIGYNPENPLTKEQCDNVISYIKTRFFRFMVSIKKKTQDAFAQVYQFVPMQDFNQKWDDERLLEKYGLSQDEIDYIKQTIKEMD